MRALQSKGVWHLGDALDRFISSYSLTNNRVRALYTALTADDIGQNHALWQPHQTAGALRHRVAHRGAQIAPQQWEDAYQACEQLITHLETIEQGFDLGG